MGTAEAIEAENNTDGRVDAMKALTCDDLCCVRVASSPCLRVTTRRLHAAGTQRPTVRAYSSGPSEVWTVQEAQELLNKGYKCELQVTGAAWACVSCVHDSLCMDWNCGLFCATYGTLFVQHAHHAVAGHSLHYLSHTPSPSICMPGPEFACGRVA